MKRIGLVIGLILALGLFPGYGIARSSHYSSSGSRSHSSGHYSSSKHSSNYSGSHHGGRKKAEGVTRDSHGRIARSERARDNFKKANPCPSTGKTSGACPGYTVDHIKPLKRGGADDPSNMQWQTKEDAKAKDKWE